MVDKAEVALALSIKLDAAMTESAASKSEEAETVGNGRIVSNDALIVSESLMDLLAKEAAKVLEIQGFSCVGCAKSRCKLFKLSDDCKGICKDTAVENACKFRLDIFCTGDRPVYSFNLSLSPSPDSKGGVRCGAIS